jgi:hypothetical protein
LVKVLCGDIVADSPCFVEYETVIILKKKKKRAKADRTLSGMFRLLVRDTGIQYKEPDQMVVSRGILVIYVPSWRNRWEQTHKTPFFLAK